jgi:hypothetical protein
MSEDDGLLAGFERAITRLRVRLERQPNWQAMVARRPRRERPRCNAKRRDGRPCGAPAVMHTRGEIARVGNRIWRVPRNGKCRVHGAG